MAKTIKINIKEEESELKYLHKQQKTISRKFRIKMLLTLQKHSDIKYPYQLAEKLNYTRKTLSGWIRLYNIGGINALLDGNYVRVKEDQRTITKNISEEISKLLENPKNTITSYPELQKWIFDNLGEEVKYSALYYHCRTHYNSRLKVARKSHHKKDEEAERFFKNPKIKN
jgi:hypothetical protein